jgi:hypothetical protein
MHDARGLIDIHSQECHTTSKMMWTDIARPRLLLVPILWLGTLFALTVLTNLAGRPAVRVLRPDRVFRNTMSAEFTLDATALSHSNRFLVFKTSLRPRLPASRPSALLFSHRTTIVARSDAAESIRLTLFHDAGFVRLSSASHEEI